MQSHWLFGAYRTRNAGLTAKGLLALLTTIAVFGVLTAICVPGGPSRSRVRRTQSIANIDSVSKALFEYAGRDGNTVGYPPAYGYLRPEAAARPVETLTDADHILEPYTATVGIQGADTVYQVLGYASSFDTNNDGKLGLMEYLPIGFKADSGDGFSFSPTLYSGSNAPRSVDLNEVEAQLEDGRARPYIYVPFNNSHLATARAYWTERGDAYAEHFDSNDARLAALAFPPTHYDGFVIIGNGPGGNDGGLASADPPGTPGEDYDVHYVYHVLGLRIAFLATRDWPGPDSAEPDKLLDFDYYNRKVAAVPHTLPDGTNGLGAFIKVVQ